MAVELRVPQVGESITEVVIAAWLKSEGERVEMDEIVAELESDKATLELPAPAGGVISKLLKSPGDTARVGEVIGYIEPATDARPSAEPAASEPASAPAPPSPPRAAPKVMPAAERLLAERGLKDGDVVGSGPSGRILKEDVLRHVPQAAVPAATRDAPPVPAPPQPSAPAPAEPAPAAAAPAADDTALLEEVVPMSQFRRRIAERLLEAQQSMALLTTFNEIDMGAVIALRKAHQERFQERYGIKLGFMSFFIKAAIEALKAVPQVNAEIRGTSIVYKNHYDIGIAVGGGKGLLVPVIRGADRLSFAELERAIADFAQRAQANKIDLDELQGGTFTISNGGVYGSLLSTPIVNPPQSGVLGLHAIEERPVARDGQVVIRPMMYVALTYDHRLIDGRESVLFLKRVKELVEEPSRILLEV
jgi:2-oxoglutarate dehydrogenase E2 component (dihydrolipoamide succinyltransferase)